MTTKPTTETTMTTGQKERVEISKMFAELGRYRNNPGEFFPREMRAKKALAEWRSKYPTESQVELDAASAARAQREAEKAAQPKLTAEQLFD
jgi:hypothetical protein